MNRYGLSMTIMPYKVYSGVCFLMSIITYKVTGGVFLLNYRHAI